MVPQILSSPYENYAPMPYELFGNVLAPPPSSVPSIEPQINWPAYIDEVINFIPDESIPTPQRNDNNQVFIAVPMPNAPFWKSYKNEEPSPLPSFEPSYDPLDATPIFSPVLPPVGQIKDAPTMVPTLLPTFGQPSMLPSISPSINSSSFPTFSQPSMVPSTQPSSNSPSNILSLNPTIKESIQPTRYPSSFPSEEPTWIPTTSPTIHPSLEPTPHPSSNPSTNVPSSLPTTIPSNIPSLSLEPTPSISLCLNNLGDNGDNGDNITPYPPIEFSAFPKGDDDSVSLFVFGDIDIIKGVEIEGKIVTVDGSMNIHKDSGFKSLVRAGYGSHLIPTNGTEAVIVGKDIRIDMTDKITFMYPGYGNIVYKGTFTGSVPQEVSHVDYDDSLPSSNHKTDGESYMFQDIDYGMTEWVEAMKDIEAKGNYWGNHLNTNCITEGIDTNTITFKAGDADTIQVCHIRCMDLTYYVGRHIQFDSSLVNKTILINVEASPDGSCDICNLADFLDTKGKGRFKFSTELTKNILWNFYDAKEVSLGCRCRRTRALGEWQGSIIVPSGDFEFCMPGHSGRLIINGNMIQNRKGSALHNYPFDPPERLPCPMSSSQSLGSYQNLI